MYNVAMSSAGSPTPSPRSTISTEWSTRASLVAVASLLAFIFFCYWPLTRFYLAQDDFSLIERADQGFRESMSPFFNFRPGQFRPLTKGLYFLFAWPIFGLHAAPYHIASLVLHAANAILVGAVLRRLGVSVLVSWVTAAIFAAHLCHLEALAWASCVQQLFGALFVFLALMFGLDALADRGRHSRLKATIAYALALCSYEQTMAAPFVLLAWLWIYRKPRDVWRAAWGPLRPMIALFAVYAVYVFVLRGMPDKGPYVMNIGSNVLVNLRDYTGLAFSVWHVYPAYRLLTDFTGAAVAWITIGALHIWLGTYRELAFGCITFLAFLGPVMFTTKHTHSFHLYVPAIGVSFLLASLAEAIRRRVGEHRGRQFAIAAICAAIVVAAGSTVAVRKNATAVLHENLPLPRTFVLRRAVIAERMSGEIRNRWTGTRRQLILVYQSPAMRMNWRNVYVALGNGSAVRLWLKQPDLDVVFVPPADLPPWSEEQEIIIYTESGYCFTLAEWEKVTESLKVRPGQ